MNERMKKIVFQKQEKLQNKPAFLDRLSVLLMEGYTFYDGIQLLLPHHMKKYDETLAAVNKDLKEGNDVTAILERIGFSSGLLLPIAIAELDGRLSSALKGMSVRLKRKEEQQQNLKKLLAYPIVLFIFISALLIAFRRFFLPNLEAFAFTRQNETTGMASILPMIVTRIPDVFGISILLLLLLFVISIWVYRKMDSKTKIRIMMSIPIIRTMFSMLKTRDFSSELGSLLQSGLSMQTALGILVEQHLDIVLSEIARNVKKLVVYGESFHSATELTTGLTSQLSAFAKHGADSGYLPKELLIYSEHLNEEIDMKVSKALSVLQPVLFCIIAICIVAAYLALLLPVYSMIDKF